MKKIFTAIILILLSSLVFSLDVNNNHLELIPVSKNISMSDALNFYIDHGYSIKKINNLSFEVKKDDNTFLGLETNGLLLHFDEDQILEFISCVFYDYTIEDMYKSILVTMNTYNCVIISYDIMQDKLTTYSKNRDEYFCWGKLKNHFSFCYRKNIPN